MEKKTQHANYIPRKKYVKKGANFSETFIFRQPYDVEDILNGLMARGRRVLKLPAGSIRKRNEDRSLTSAKRFRIDV
jgi:hypothetical protein